MSPLKELGTKESILIYFVIVMLIAYVLQVIKFIKTKSSKEHSILTWVFMLASNVIFIVYLLLGEVSRLLLAIQIVNVVLVCYVVCLILYYRFMRWFTLKLLEHKLNKQKNKTKRKK